MESKGTPRPVRLGQRDLALLIVLSILGQCCSGPVQQANPVSSEDFRGTWIYAVVLTLGVLITLISTLFICGAGGCCGLGEIHWFGRTRANLEGPMSFENPVALEGGTMMTQLSQIDVRALELDPVVFEPLPSIQDLSPLTVNPYSGVPKTRAGGTASGASPHSPTSFLNTAGLPSSIPFSNKETNVFAHDWFEEPYDNFSRNNLEYLREVGKGWFGQVMEADAKDIVPYARNLRVLVKILRSDASQIDQMKFLDESRWYRDSAGCGNILKLLGHSLEKLPFLLIMEQCPQGDLKSFLIANVIRAEMLSSQGTLLRMALDIAKGLEWMASADFVHHDLAARNCQVASEGRVVLGDYGLSTQQYRDDYYWNSNVPIPLRWTAPETLHITSSTIQTLEVSKLSNIWTFAIVLWEIMEFGKLPYFELNDEEVISRVIADKNYVLGQPTLPYIPLKEQLYSIMTSCWSVDPIKRPTMPSIVLKLKELLNTLTSQGSTPNSIRTKPAATSTPQEQFDSRWDQIGRSSTSSSISGLGGNNNGSNDEKRKKSVSFTGLIEDSKASDLPESETLRHESTSILAQADVGAVIHQQDETDDDACWSRISQKVQEKSQSVQNLMVLTHVDSSELGDPDSLLFVLADKDSVSEDKTKIKEFQSPSGSGSCSEPSSTTVTPQPKPPPNTPSNSTDSVFEVQPLASNIENRLQALHDQSETNKTNQRINETSSQQPQSNNSSLSNVSSENSKPVKPKPAPLISVPEISLVPSAPGTTKNITGIDINVIQPSPTPNADVSKELTPSIEIPSQSRPVKFVFSPNSKASDVKVDEKERRNTSTPISSPAVDFDETPPDGEVFNEVVETEINTTGPISPIKCDRKIAPAGELVTTVLMGANDEYGLSEYQGVSTNLIDSSLGRNLNNQLGSDEIETLTPSPKEFKSGATYSVLPTNGSHLDNSNVNTKNVSNGDERQHQPERSFHILGQVKNGGPFSLTPRPTNGVESPDDTVTDPKSDGDEFWSDQIERLRSDTKSTKELLELSLSEDGDYKKERFVEDIEAAQEELGSLVLTDLEDESNSVHTIVPESSRESCKSNDVEAKMAFVSGADDSMNLDTSSTFNSSRGYVASMSSSSQEAAEWDVNSSVDIEKARLFVDKSILDVSWAGQKKEPMEDEVSSFVPSKWNQTLTPIRPAIKSPAVVPVEKEEECSKPGGMKKSVSFERNKTQLVYKYPPPDPGSDSDGDESNISLNARLRLSSGTNSGTSTRTAIPMFPSAASLDWDLTQEELEANEINNEESDEEDLPKVEAADPMNMYRISGFADLTDEPNFQVRGSDEPFAYPPPFAPSTLGELRHTKDRLRLDLNSKGEASLLDEDGNAGAGGGSSKHRLVEVQTPPPKLDSGVGSSAATSTSVSPFFAATNSTHPSYENNMQLGEDQPKSDSNVANSLNLMEW